MSLFKLSPGTGTIVWTQDLMDGTGSLRAIEVDPSDGNLVVVGGDNSAWTGASGTTAHMCRVPSGTGAIPAYHSLSSNVDAMVLAVHSDGSIFYGTEYIP